MTETSLRIFACTPRESIWNMLTSYSIIKAGRPMVVSKVALSLYSDSCRVPVRPITLYSVGEPRPLPQLSLSSLNSFKASLANQKKKIGLPNGQSLKPTATASKAKTADLAIGSRSNWVRLFQPLGLIDNTMILTLEARPKVKKTNSLSVG